MSTTNAVSNITELMLERIDAAAFIRETLGVPVEATDLERAAQAGNGPPFRRWGRKALYTRADLGAWARQRLSPPIRKASDYPRREAGISR